MAKRLLFAVAGLAVLMVLTMGQADVRRSIANLTGNIRTFGGAPVLSTCGDGALQTGSNGTAGTVVGTTQTACTLTFAPAMAGNSAVCVFENITANRGNITAASTSAFTVSGLTAGDDFMYLCLGR